MTSIVPFLYFEQGTVARDGDVVKVWVKLELATPINIKGIRFNKQIQQCLFKCPKKEIEAVRVIRANLSNLDHNYPK